MNTLERHLRDRRDQGLFSLVPYVTAGVSADWVDHLTAYAEAGAAAIEVGIPFSDPMLDGATIQRASHRALERGTTFDQVCDQLADAPRVVPRVLMAYANTVVHTGVDHFVAGAVRAGASGIVVPDLPLEEVGPLRQALADADLDHVLLAAPSTRDARLAEVARLGQGFTYVVSVMGTTGARDESPQAGSSTAARLRELSDLPLLVGFGISTPGQVAELHGHADGAVVASALMDRLLAGESPQQVAGFLRQLQPA